MHESSVYFALVLIMYKHIIINEKLSYLSIYKSHPHFALKYSYLGKSANILHLPNNININNNKSSQQTQNISGLVFNT